MNGGSFNENITQNDSGAIKVTYGTFFTANNVTFNYQDNSTPNKVENVGCGSVIPLSVPASFEVKPVTK